MLPSSRVFVDTMEAKALHDFQATAPDELSFGKGQTLKVSLNQTTTKKKKRKRGREKKEEEEERETSERTRENDWPAYENAQNE
mgnify:CR=1 FL=1